MQGIPLTITCIVRFYNFTLFQFQPVLFGKFDIFKVFGCFFVDNNKICKRKMLKLRAESNQDLKVKNVIKSVISKNDAS